MTGVPVGIGGETQTQIQREGGHKKTEAGLEVILPKAKNTQGYHMLEEAKKYFSTRAFGQSTALQH